FRTPLAIINTSVDLFVQYGAKITSQKQENLQKRIYDSVFYLTDLIQDISLINTANTEGITIVPTTDRFASLCRALEVNLVAELGRPSNLTFQYDAETNENVAIDYNHLQQVLLNLVVNALKYSAESQMVTVRLSYIAPQLKFEVIDQGIGIPAEDMEHIWEMFYRGRNVETRRGLGLGLYIVKRVVIAMGGQITAASAGENQGSTFTITLPQEEVIEGDGGKASEPEKP
ncbi:MAG: HAMP domain-containing histidine kinase, partial [Anaerolineales bacterium]|nr:HAMP domain-containing histidine kinase [Anaerolineales bacterium]